MLEFVLFYFGFVFYFWESLKLSQLETSGANNSPLLNLQKI